MALITAAWPCRFARASERCNVARGTAHGLRELQDRGFIECVTQGAFSRKVAARQRMASDLVELRCDRRIAEQEVHELGPRKTKRGIKISASRYQIRAHPRASEYTENSLTVPSFDTVNAVLGWSRYQSRAHI